MSNGKSTALIILSLVIGASGLGIGAYSLVKFQIIEGPDGPIGPTGEDGVDGVNGTDGINGSLNNVIGVWESVLGTLDTSFYLNFSDNQVHEEGFFELTDYNSTITLTQEGWYRFYIRISWMDLTAGQLYMLSLYKNGAVDQHLAWLYDHNTYAYVVEASCYVYSDGDDYFQFRSYNQVGGDALELSTNQDWNQFVMEYIKEV